MEFFPNGSSIHQIISPLMTEAKNNSSGGCFISGLVFYGLNYLRLEGGETEVFGGRD